MANQVHLQTFKWRNKLVIEAYDQNDEIASQTLVSLADIPIYEAKEVMQPVVINEAKVLIHMTYTPLNEEEDRNISYEKSGDKSKAGAAGTKDKGKAGGPRQ